MHDWSQRAATQRRRPCSYAGRPIEVEDNLAISLTTDAFPSSGLGSFPVAHNHISTWPCPP
eukprot:1157837-Pelagomonas_calceolata.AAC.4